jgi:hypothetical protein
MPVECTVLLKRKQALKPGGAWVRGLWGKMVYVPLDVARKQGDSKCPSRTMIGYLCKLVRVRQNRITGNDEK